MLGSLEVVKSRGRCPLDPRDLKRRSIRDSVANLRNKLLANPKFQALAAKFPLTRPVAQREAKALFDLCAGFVYAQILSACVELDIFEALEAGPLEGKNLAAQRNIAPQKLSILLDAAVSLRLLENSASGYRLGMLGAALRGNAGLPEMIRHHRLFYADMADPVALLRGTAETQLGRFWPYQGAGEPAQFSGIMAATQGMIAAEILSAYGFKKHQRVLDAGGGDGRFLRALGARYPHLGLTLFDLPEVVALAPAGPERVGGDLLGDCWPAGADVVTLIRVLHDHPDESVVKILQNARAALGRGGVLLVAEPLAGTPGAETMGAAYFGFYLLAMGSGQARRFEQLKALLEAAGFGGVRRHRTAQPLITSVVSARVF